MGKNKKKSVSKVIVGSPLSNGSDNDEPVKSEELTTLPSPSTLPEEDLTTLVNIKIELEPEIIQLVEQKQDATVEQKQEEPVEQKQDATVEQKQDAIAEQQKDATVEQKQDATVEQKQDAIAEQKQDAIAEQKQDQMNEKEISQQLNSENIELKEIQISNSETSSSPQKKATGCSRGWCSIL